MATINPFDLLGADDNDDPTQLLAAAAAAKQKAEAKKQAAAATAGKGAQPAPAKLPTKPAPPAQAVKESWSGGPPSRGGYGHGERGRGRGGRGYGQNRDYGTEDANGFQGGYGQNRDYARAGGEEGAQDRERGPRPPYRGVGGGRRGGYRDGEFGDDSERPPRRPFERHSGTGRGFEMKREGSGRGNWGTTADEIIARETEEGLKLEEKAPAPEKQGAPEDTPQAEENKENKDVTANEEEEKEEDKEMTLEEFEKIREEKRKALLALKTEERKVEVDRDLQSMQPLANKKGNDEIFVKLVDFDLATMSSELADKGLGPAEQVPHTMVETTAEKSFEPLEFGVKDEKVEVVSNGLDELLAPDQLLVSAIGDLAVREDTTEGDVVTEMAAAPPAPADAEMSTTVSVEVESEGAKEGQEAPPAPADAEMMSTTVSVEVQPGGGKEGLESSDEESESESSEEDDDESSSSEASSSSEEEEQGVNKDEESSEASSSEEEELGVKRHGGKADNLETLLEEGELMVGSDEEDEEQKGGSKSKYEAEVLPPVPKIDIQLKPHHQTLPVGTISAIMGERVIVEGSIQHNPLNEGSILWITESRTPLGIVDELFGPVKNPYYLVRYNSEEEVPTGISAGTNVSFVVEFADHILNMKELYAKGYDESDPVDNDEEEDLPDFSDDEKEAQYKRSLRQAKRRTDRQHEPMKTSGDRKRSQSRGRGIRKPMPPRNMDTSTPGHQPRPHFHRSDMSPAGSQNTTCPLGPQNAPMIAPTMLPPGPMNLAVPSPVPLANQMGGCFMNPAQQQFLPQQPNMVWPGGFPQPPHPNMGVDGAALAANIMQSLLAGANQFQQQFQNQNFSGTGANQFPQQFQNQNFSGPGPNQFQQLFQNQNFDGFPNQMPMPFPQFMPQTGMPANPMPFGGRPPVNSPFGPAAPQVPVGQGNFGQPPNAQGLAPPRGDGEQDSPPQFSPRQFHQGSSSFAHGRTQQRGGRHSSGRGGRGGWHRR